MVDRSRLVAGDRLFRCLDCHRTDVSIVICEEEEHHERIWDCTQTVYFLLIKCPEHGPVASLRTNLYPALASKLLGPAYNPHSKSPRTQPEPDPDAEPGSRR